MIHIHTHDTIIDIIEKIEKESGEDIRLYFPSGHPVIHNHLSLKIIQSKCKHTQLTIFTSDIIGKKICRNVGISVGKEKIKQHPANIMNYNFTAKEYFIHLLRNYKKEFFTFLQQHKKINQISRYQSQNIKSLRFFIGIFLMSLLLFFIVYYIAISKTSVIISPETHIQKEALNFILDINSKSSILGNNNTVRLEPIEETFYSSHIYSATDIKIDENNTAQGKIRVYNYSPEEISLKPNTRFQSEQGIIYSQDTWIKIPASSTDNFGTISPGSIELVMQAQIKDASGKIAGSAANISSGQRLTIPGLSEDFQEIVYGETLEDFTGGSDNVIRIISQGDIDTTRELFEEKLKRDAFEKLKEKIDTLNQINGTQKKLLIGENSIQYKDTSISLEAGIRAGDEKENFSYSGNITVQARIYNTESIIQKLQSVVKEKTLTDYEKIKNIDKDSLRLAEIVSINNKGKRVKATFEVQVIKYYDISEKNTSFRNNLKNKIAGKSIEEAENILINTPNIKSAYITNRPFFIGKVTNILNNIIIKVQL